MTFQANPLTSNWDTLTGLVDSVVFRHRDDGALHSRYAMMFGNLRHDKFCYNDQVVVLGLMRCPGSVRRHHAYEGGLVAHMLEMWEIWAEHMKPFVERFKLPTFVDDSMVLRAIIHHDLGKVYKYQLKTADPWEVDYAKRWDRAGRLLGDTHKALYFLGDHDIFLPLVLHNALITSHGGFTKDAPDAETVFAKVVYMLDELSANVSNRLETNKFWDSLAGGIDE